MTNNKRIQADLILLLAAIIWGSAFVPQRMIANDLGVFLFNGSRFILGGLVLLPLQRFRLQIDRKSILPVMLAGFLLFIASAFQQEGLKTTSAGNAGFITGLYVVLVPIILSIFFKVKLHWASWVAALLSVVGLFLLSIDQSFTINYGDVLEFSGALFWALHIIVVSIMVKRMDVISFSILQFLVCGFISLIFGMVIESHIIQNICTSGWAILYTGIFSVGFGYTLQAIGQKNSPPTDAAIILSMEAVFAAFFGFLFIQEIMDMQKIIGCILILFAIVLAQLFDHQEIKVF